LKEKYAKEDDTIGKDMSSEAIEKEKAKEDELIKFLCGKD
jgi:hypothetical protein